MTYSADLGYDPDEWEECPAPDHFLAFSFVTRISLTVLTLLFSVLFFYVLELRKLPPPRSVQAAEEIEARKSISGPASGEAETDESRHHARAELSRVVEQVQREKSVSRSPKRRPSRRPFSPEEQSALIEWEREVQEVAERRLRDSEEEPPMTTDASLTYGLPANAFENQSLLSEFVGPSAPTAAANAEGKFEQQQRAPDQQQQQQHPQGGRLPPATDGGLYKSDSGGGVAGTPPCTPPGDSAAAVDDFDFRRRMAADLHAKLLEAAKAESVADAETVVASNRDTDAEQAERQRRKILKGVAASGALDDASLNASAAVADAEEAAAAVHQARSPSSAAAVKKGSSSSEEGFVKVGRDELDAAYTADDAAGVPPRQLSALDAALFEYDSSAQASEKPSPTSPTAPRHHHHQQQQPRGGLLCVAEPSSPLLTTDDSAPPTAPAAARRISVEGGADDDTTADDIEFVHSPASSLPFGGSPKSASRVIRTVPPSEAGAVHPLSTTLHQEPLRVDFTAPGRGGTGEADGLNAKSGAQSPSVDLTERGRICSSEADAMLRLLEEYENVPPTYSASQRRQQPPEDQRQQQQEEPAVVRPRLLSNETLSDDRSPYDNLVEPGHVAPAKEPPPIRCASVLTRQPQTVDVDAPILPQPTYNFPRQQQQQQHQQAPAALFSPDTTHTTTTTLGGGKEAGFVMEEEMLESDKQQPSSPPMVRNEHYYDDQPLLMVQRPGHHNQTAVDQPESQQITPQPPPSSRTTAARLLEAVAAATVQADDGAVTVRVAAGQTAPATALTTEARQHATSAEPTSRLVKTNEVFEKPEPIFDDADDAVTYAPEIQSVEIPPDQLSENDNSSLNLVEENFSECQEPAAPGRAPRADQPPETVAAALKQPDGVKLPNTVADSTTTRLQHQRPPHLNAAASTPPSVSSQAQQRPKAPKFMKSKPKKRNGAAGDATAGGSVSAFFVDEDSISSSTTTTTTRSINKQSSLLSVLGVTSMQEMLLKLTSLDELSDAMRRAGLESTNLIFGIDYTASNKYQGEHSFRGRSLHLIERGVENPYQQVIKIMGRTLAPFSGANSTGIPVYGFGDLSTGDWSVFPLKDHLGDDACDDLEEVLKVYNEVTPSVDLSGPTNFAPLIYRAISICQRVQDYHILVIIADGQVTNERATRKAIVHACQYPLSIIVVGVGDGPWDMMRVFDESLPKRPWDNFHFVEFYEIMNASERSPELEFAIHSLLEIPDQYNHVRKMGLLPQKEQSPQTPLP